MPAEASNDNAVPTTNAEVAAPEAAPAPSPEPAFIEVWRPGRRVDNRPPRRERRDDRPKREGRGLRRPDAANTAAPAAADSVPPVADGLTPPVAADAAAPAQGATDHGRPERRGRERGRRGRGNGDAPRERRGDRSGFVTPPPRKDQPERAVDPDSPFAALAALKAELEARQRDT
jgi:ATP-dependent RNA helicase SUPV3L1/SUV3